MASSGAGQAGPPAKPTHAELEEGPVLYLDWDKLKKVAGCGHAVMPVCVQHADTNHVLVVAYANAFALQETIKRKVCVLWSTSRNELWIKGATSGDTLDLVEVRVNCEQNSLLYLVRPRRQGACHTRDASGSTRPSCYYRRLLVPEGGDAAAGTLEHAPLAPAGGWCVPCEDAAAALAEAPPPSGGVDRRLCLVAVAVLCGGLAALRARRSA